jgi:hypothetical protein
MGEKNMLTVYKMMNEDVVQLSSSPSLYVDDKWFETHMGEAKEDPLYTNYPVKIKAMKIRWYILSEHGKKFLTAIYNNEDIDLYNIPTLRIMIEFFYKQYKNFLLEKDMPLFVFKSLIFIMTLVLSEADIYKHLHTPNFAKVGDGFHHFAIVVLVLL